MEESQRGVSNIPAPNRDAHALATSGLKGGCKGSNSCRGARGCLPPAKTSRSLLGNTSHDRWSLLLVFPPNRVGTPPHPTVLPAPNPPIYGTSHSGSWGQQQLTSQMLTRPQVCFLSEGQRVPYEAACWGALRQHLPVRLLQRSEEHLAWSLPGPNWVCLGKFLTLLVLCFLLYKMGSWLLATSLLQALNASLQVKHAGTVLDGTEPWTGAYAPGSSAEKWFLGLW